MDNSTIAGKEIRSWRDPQVSKEFIKLLRAPDAKKRNSLTNRNLDFWLLGGLSIFVWMLLIVMDHFKFSNNSAVDRHLYNLPFAFSLLTLVCNHPHFISSYKFGYGRGWRFIFRHWFALIAVPCALLTALIVSYLTFGKGLETDSWLQWINQIQLNSPLKMEFGKGRDVGSEILGLCVWSMWFTVGWHYAKQIFGCMMLYSHYDNYRMPRWQKLALRINLLSVAFVNFAGGNRSGQSIFIDLQINKVSIAPSVETLGWLLVYVSGAVVIASFAQNYFKSKKLPSLNFLVSGIAFYVWWLPGIFAPEYAMLVVPFFHSLQYLPFSFKMLQSGAEHSKTKRFGFGLTAQILAILFVGAVVFDFAPAALDGNFESTFAFGCSFFTIAGVVFLNVHHFFIDSVIWHSHQPEFKRALL